MKLFVVGKNIKETEDGIIWEIIGIYDDKEKGLKACTKSEYFIGELELNETLPDDSEVWPGCHYPLLTSNTEAE